MDELVVRREVQQGIEQDFAVLFSGAYTQANRAMERIWAHMREEWLRGYGSVHTQRAYRNDTDAWLDFLSTLLTPEGDGLMPWMVDARHVRMWMEAMTGEGLSASTVNRRLAACSSWYSYILNERHLVDGVERTVFFDANGVPRSNPFHAGNVNRPDVTAYKAAQPLSVEAIGKVLGSFNQETRTGARGYGLLLTIFLTGWRVAEALDMTWGRVRPSRSQPGSFVYDWSGKGGKEASDALPARVYHAIVAYLKADGRWNPHGGPDGGPGPNHIGPHDYVWQPLVTHGLVNLLAGDEARGKGAKTSGPISAQSANRILRTAIRNAGIPRPDSYRIHDLRHSLAHAHYEEFRDIKAVQMILHHSSSAITDRYLQQIGDPVDVHSETLFQKLLFSE